ncbi:hypothetical protein ACHAWF_011361 [Thalassiosira exigua]
MPFPSFVSLFISPAFNKNGRDHAPPEFIPAPAGGGRPALQLVCAAESGQVPPVRRRRRRRRRPSARRRARRRPVRGSNRPHRRRPEPVPRRRRRRRLVRARGEGRDLGPPRPRLVLHRVRVAVRRRRHRARRQRRRRRRHRTVPAQEVPPPPREVHNQPQLPGERRLHQHVQRQAGRVGLPDRVRERLRERRRGRVQQVRRVRHDVRPAEGRRRVVSRPAQGEAGAEVRHQAVERAVVHHRRTEQALRHLPLSGPLLHRDGAREVLRKIELAHRGARRRVLHSGRRAGVLPGSGESRPPDQPRQRLPPLSRRLVHRRLRRGRQQGGRPSLRLRVLPRRERRVDRVRRGGGVHARREAARVPATAPPRGGQEGELRLRQGLRGQRQHVPSDGEGRAGGVAREVRGEGGHPDGEADSAAGGAGADGGEQRGRRGGARGREGGGADRGESGAVRAGAGAGCGEGGERDRQGRDQGGAGDCQRCSEGGRRDRQGRGEGREGDCQGCGGSGGRDCGG